MTPRSVPKVFQFNVIPDEPAALREKYSVVANLYAPSDVAESTELAMDDMFSLFGKSSAYRG